MAVNHQSPSINSWATFSIFNFQFSILFVSLWRGIDLAACKPRWACVARQKVLKGNELGISLQRLVHQTYPHSKNRSLTELKEGTLFVIAVSERVA